jgi:DNA polymerase III sliding clamp (beta) subunit (PCNA family)
VYSGDPIKIGCDPRLLIAALRPVAAAGEIRLRMRKATQPILIETPNQSYRHVLMPVSL